MIQNMNTLLYKNCVTCNSIILKKQNASISSWNNRVKYCSVECRYESIRGKKLGDETKTKMSLAHMGNKSNTGRKLTEEHKKNVSLSLQKEKHWNWQGGITKINHQLRNLQPAKEWNSKIKERDEYNCRIRNKDCKGKLEAHHILPWSKFPELRYKLNNGITLCRFHHPLGVRHSLQLSPYFQEVINQTI